MLWLIQLVLPVALLLWLALRPARHPAVRALQIVGTAAILCALHLAGLWIILPWWTPWLYWVLFAVVLVRSLRVSRPGRSGWADVGMALFWTGVLGAGGWLTFHAMQARTPPAGEIAEFASPLSDGNFLVANGGSRPILSAHTRTLPRRTTGQRNYWGQSHGVDIIAIDRWGRPAARDTMILAPCAGRVVRADDGVADGRPIDLDSPTARAGNHVMIRCGQFDVLLAHFRRGSVRVATGDAVRTGQPLALMGNSGASDMPHLHIHAQRPGVGGVPFSGEPVPMRIAGRYLVRGDRL